MAKTSMSCKRTKEWKLPSVREKIKGEPFLLTQKFPKSLTTGIKFHHSGNPYLNGRCQRSWLLPNQTLSSDSIPRSTVLITSPKEKRYADIDPVQAAKKQFSRLMALVAVAPLSRVSLLMQCQNEMIKSGRLSQPFNGIGNCFSRTIRNEGVTSLWKGNGLRVIGYYPLKALLPLIIGNPFSSLLTHRKKEDGLLKYMGILALGHTLLSATYLLGTYPIDYAYTRLVNDIKSSSNNKRQFNGFVDVCKKTIKSDGLTGLYRGYNIAVAETFINTWVFIGVGLLAKPGIWLGLFGFKYGFVEKTLMLFGLKIFADMATYPMDTVRHRMMMNCGEDFKYKSSIDALLQICKKEGFETLFRGAGASLLQRCVFPVVVTIVYFAMKKKKGSGGGDQSTSKITISYKKSGLDPYP